MEFDKLLDRLWMYDFEVLAHDTLCVFINYRTGEEKYFHNSPADSIIEWLNREQPILCAYNCNNYDKHILRGWVSGMTPEDLKQVNDHIIGGGNGWDIEMDYVKLPTHWDLFNEINPRKSLKEIEGNLRLDITESTISFDIPTKLTPEEFDELLYYCRQDVKALIPLFDKLKNDYKSKFIICKYGGIDPEYGLSQTNANLTAILLKAKKTNHDDNFKYVYPDVIDKSKIPQEALDYFDDIIEHNDLNYNPDAPLLHFKDIDFQLGIGGGHAFKKEGTYTYTKGKSKKVLCNWDYTSLYPNIVRIFGYSSRNQSYKDAYVDLLNLRMDAKKGKLTEEFLAPFGLTNKDLNTGLKLPLNAYTGGLRAKFNNLYDNLQGFSICTTGQLIILQMIHDLEQVPTLEMVSANTDAVMFEVDPKYKQQADDIIHAHEKLTGLEMEEDNIIKIVMRDVNNYCELVQVGDDDYIINCKGGEFKYDTIKKNMKFVWNKETRVWTTQFEDSVKVGSLTICGEALARYLLLDEAVEDTITNCDDIFRFQMISHCGSTYKGCTLEYPNGEIINIQNNNRIYAGKNKTGGKIYKIKPDGQKDSLANCPPNPIVDNKNEATIEDIDKKWYIKYTKQKISDFLRNGEVFMEEKLDKLKKDELVELVKKLQEDNEQLIESRNGEWTSNDDDVNESAQLLHKIQLFRAKVRRRNFILDQALPSNLGGKETYSIDQIYHAIQDIALEVGLDFQFDVVDVIEFNIGAFKPATGAPQNIATVKCEIQLYDIETGLSKTYTMISQGSDSIDKAVNGASSYALRNWFNKNFTPAVFNGERVTEDGDMLVIDDTPVETKSVPKTPVFVTPEKKEQIVEQLVSNPQVTDNNSDVDVLTELIYEYRALSGNATAGANKLDAIINKNYTDIDLMNWKMSFENAIADLKKGN